MSYVFFSVTILLYIMLKKDRYKNDSVYLILKIVMLISLVPILWAMFSFIISLSIALALVVGIIYLIHKLK